jgi:hypothetical protein
VHSPLAFILAALGETERGGGGGGGDSGAHIHAHTKREREREYRRSMIIDAYRRRITLR